MGRRGPKPEPASVKKQKGNPGRRPIGEDPELSAAEADSSENAAALSAPATSGKSVRPPDWLEGHGLQIWQRLAPRLQQMRLLGTADVETFARYCRNFARWLDANAKLDELGSPVYETETGYERMRAAMMVSLRLEPVLERIEDRFGLNPAERQRIFAQRAALGAAGELPLTSPAKAKAEHDEGKSTPPAAPPSVAPPVGFLQ